MFTAGRTENAGVESVIPKTLVRWKMQDWKKPYIARVEKAGVRYMEY